MRYGGCRGLDRPCQGHTQVRLRAFFPIIAFGCLVACGSLRDKRWAERERYVGDCRDRWQRIAMVDTQAMVVIYAQNGFRFDQEVYPNFLIGTVANGDTIGFVDLDWPTDSSLSDTLWLVPGDWSPQRMAEYTPAHQVFADKKINSLYCGVKTLYYGRMLRP